MKTLATFLLLAMAVTAVAQRSTYNQTIDENGGMMEIRIAMEEQGRSIRYENSFDVRGMSKEEKDDLISRVQEAVRTGKPVQTQTHNTATGWKPSTSIRASAGTWASEETFATASASVPFDKSVEKDPEAMRLKVIYRYFSNGEEHILERTINTRGRTEQEIQEIIQETEESLTETVNCT